jgi:hypothetical protein
VASPDAWWLAHPRSRALPSRRTAAGRGVQPKWVYKWQGSGPKRRVQSSAGARRRDGGNGNGSNGGSALSVEGISKVIFSLTIRPFPKWGWVLASGVVGILVALYLWASLPVTAIWLLGVPLGIQLVCEGAALGYLAWKVRTG